MKKSSKSVWSRFVMTFAAAFLLMLVTTVPVKADSSVPLVADMKQTDASTTSAGISWSCPGSDIRFKVEWSNQMSTGYHDYNTRTQSSASVTLAKLSAGNVYQVVYSQSGTANEFTKETTGTSVTLKKLSKDARYTIQVRAGMKYTDGRGRAWGPGTTKYDVPVKPTKVEGVKVKGYYQNLSKINITNKAKTCADGYQYQLYTAYKGQDKETKVKSISVNQNNPSSSNMVSANMKVSALNKHNFYKVRVRAYSLNSKNEKIYGVWSSWKYVSPQPDVTKKQKVKKGIKIKWDKINGADNYVVYVSTKKNYYFYVEPQKKVGNKYVSGLAGNANYCWSLKYKK